MPEAVGTERSHPRATTRLLHNTANTGRRQFMMRSTHLEKQSPAHTGDPVLLTISGQGFTHVHRQGQVIVATTFPRDMESTMSPIYILERQAGHFAGSQTKPREEEILALIRATNDLTPRFRALTYQTLLGLLASTGMRVGEALRLNQSDVDVIARQLTIQFTKFGKSRILPLHPTVMAALAAYRTHRNAYAARWPATDSFFISIRGSRLLDPSVHLTFRRLVTVVGLSPRDGSGLPRIHGLRHSFTVATLRDWYATGQPVASQLPLLSAYLGHVNPVSTYWYIQTDPELLRHAMEQGERIPTVRP